MNEDAVVSPHPERRIPRDEPAVPRGQLPRVRILLSKRLSERASWRLAGGSDGPEAAAIRSTSNF